MNINELTAEINRIVTEETISDFQRKRISEGGYAKDGFYYTIREFSAEHPEGLFYAGLASREHAEDALFMARYFNPGNEYKVTEIRELAN